MAREELNLNVPQGMVRMAWNYSSLGIGLVGFEAYKLAFARSNTQWGLFKWDKWNIVTSKNFNGVTSNAGFEIPSQYKGGQFPYIQSIDKLHIEFKLSGGPTMGGIPTVEFTLSGGHYLNSKFYSIVLPSRAWGFKVNETIEFSGQLTNISESGSFSLPAPPHVIAQAMLNK